jgi:hypothetical protein
MHADRGLLTHLRTYLRLMASQTEALQRLSHLATDRNLQKVHQHLRNIRLATRDLEETFAKAAARAPAATAAPANEVIAPDQTATTPQG